MYQRQYQCAIVIGNYRCAKKLAQTNCFNFHSTNDRRLSRQKITLASDLIPARSLLFAVGLLKAPA
jgi:hypothetical protein